MPSAASRTESGTPSTPATVPDQDEQAVADQRDLGGEQARTGERHQEAEQGERRIV